MKPKMKVLYLIAGASLSDGIARHILTLCEFLSTREDVEVAVCVTHEEGDLTVALREVGVQVYALNCRNGHDVQIFGRFRKVLQEYQPDLIHSHVMSLYIRIYLSLRARALPVISTIHGVADPAKDLSQRLRAHSGRWLDYFFQVNEKAVLMISTAVQQTLEGNSPKFKSRVLYNPVSLEAVPDRESIWLKTEIGVPATTPLVGFIGRLAGVKDLPAFLQATRLVLEKCPGYHFVIVGDGPDECYKNSDLMRGLESNVHWLGYRTDAKRIMAALDLFVLTSFREGMPSVLLEAFSVRTPVVGFVSPGGVQEVSDLSKQYTNGVADFVEGRDVQKLAHSIQSILEDHSNPSPTVCNAYHLVEKLFDVRVVGAQLVDMYQEALNS